LKKSTWKAFPILFCISLGFWVFAFLIQRTEPWNYFAFPALLLSILLISFQFNSFRQLKTILGISKGNHLFIFLFLAILIGSGMGIYHRITIEMTPLPLSLGGFALIAAGIGISEELIFRGFLQGKATKINIYFGLLFASFAHAVYKFLLFIYPNEPYDYNVWYLLGVTFLAGLLAGFARQKTKSIYPAIVGHALFDVVVYGELTGAPWWVW